MAEATANGTWSYRPALDGLRTVAVYLVLLFHSGIAGMANGYIGVDVFFVLSGFLVTSIILREHADSGRVRLRRFYARRVRRLLPASVVTVVVVCAMSTLVLPRLWRVSLVPDARAALLYVANWHFLGSATDYFGDDIQRSPFLHFWSLAVEEQFYVVYPLVLIGILAVGRRLRRSWVVPTGLAALFLASLTAQWLVSANDQLRAYYGTDTRLYQLLAGALLATMRHRLPRWTGRGGSIVPVLAVVALVALASDVWSMSIGARGIAAAVVTAVLVAALEVAPGSFAARSLSVPPLTYLGRISYGTYLWHWPIIVLVGAGWAVSPGWMVVVAGVGATALAAVSFALLETPIRRSPRLDGVPRRVVAIGLATSVVVAVVAVPRLLEIERRPTWSIYNKGVPVVLDGLTPQVDRDALEAALAAAPPSVLDVDATATPPFSVTACAMDTIEGCYLHRGSGLKVHLLGDSNAIMLYPVLKELAEQYDFTLSASMQLGCPWQLGMEWDPQSEGLVDHCIEERDKWYDEIVPELDPDVVVAVNVPRDPGSRPDAFWRLGDDLDPALSIEEAIRVTTNSSLDRFRAMGARTVLVEPLPYDMQDPTICVSGASTVGDCAYNANTEPFPTEVVYRAADDSRDDVWSIDADGLACPYLPVCLPVMDGELVFRDEFHLSNRYLVEHADTLWALLVESGALSGWFDPA